MMNEEKAETSISSKRGRIELSKVEKHKGLICTAFMDTDGGILNMQHMNFITVML